MTNGWTHDALLAVLQEDTVQLRRQSMAENNLDELSGLHWLLDQVEELMHADPAMADSVIDLVLEQHSIEASGVVAARAFYARARIRADRGELRTALGLIGTARDIWVESGMHLEGLRSDLGRMQVLDDLGRHSEAAQVGESLLAALDGYEPDDATDSDLVRVIRAGAWSNVGIAYGFTGEHERSVQSYALAEAEYFALGRATNVAQQQANRGVELLALGRLSQARDLLQSAIAVFTKADDSLWAAKSGVPLAETQSQLGELVEALRVLGESRAVLQRLGAKAELARVSLEIGRTYLAAGLFADASTLAAEAAGEFLDVGMKHDSAYAHFTMGLGCIGSGDLDQAETQLLIARLSFEQVGDRQYEALCLLAAAEIATRRDQPSIALDVLSDAAEKMITGGWHVPLAWVYLRQFDLCTEAARCAEALRSARDLVDEVEIPALRYAYILRAARARRSENNPLEAERLLRDAMALGDARGANLPDLTLRTAFRADALAAHDELVDLLSNGTPEQVVEAVHVADQAKAKTLTELMDGTLGRRTQRSCDQRETQMNRLRIELSAAYGALVVADRQERRDLIREQAQRLEQELSSLRLRRTLNSTSTRPLSAERIQVLPRAALPVQPLLTYHVVGQDVLVFAVRGEVVRVRRLTGVLPAIDVALGRLASQWTRVQLGPEFLERHMSALKRSADTVLGQLWKLLMEPVVDLIQDWQTTGFTVVPHKQLHQVPFHAMHDGTGYVLDQWAIDVCPVMPWASPSSTCAPDSGPSITTGDNLLIFAVPDARAPAISREAEQLHRAMPDARVVFGAEATSDLLAGLLPGPRFLHLACHGLYRDANPLFSAIKLADRWVTSTDILEWDIGGALVTLSACESGRAATHTAEPVGLAWAFLAAGASGVIVSQWLVDDEVTTELMTAMYSGLTRSLPVSAALREAQLSVAENHPHPYHWAPFVHVAAPSLHTAGVTQ